MGVKCPQFSFSRLSGADPVLSVEMASTEKWDVLDDRLRKRFWNQWFLSAFKFQKGVLFSAGDTKSKLDLLPVAQFLQRRICTYSLLPVPLTFCGNGVIAQKLEKISASGNESMLGLICSREIDLVINIPKTMRMKKLPTDTAFDEPPLMPMSHSWPILKSHVLLFALEEFPTIESLPVLSEGVFLSLLENLLFHNQNTICNSSSPKENFSGTDFKTFLISDKSHSSFFWNFSRTQTFDTNHFAKSLSSHLTLLNQSFSTLYL